LTAHIGVEKLAIPEMKAPYLAVYRASGISVVRARHSLDESSQDLTTFYSKERSQTSILMPPLR